MVITKADFAKFLDVVSNPNYGPVTYTCTQNTKFGGYDVWIKNCSHATITDLIKAGFCVSMESKGLLVYKF